MMDFDHRDPSMKSFALSGKVQLKSEEALLREVAKCDVVCANCHRETHVRLRAFARDHVIGEASVETAVRS